MSRLVRHFANYRTVSRSFGSIALSRANKMDKIGPKVQNFDSFLVLDFEATCDHPKQIEPMEVIEFPVIKVNAKTFETEEVFHRYVRPKHHPKLRPFCTQLTGIIDDMVADEPHFDVVLNDFNRWLHAIGLIADDLQTPTKRFAFVTCGEWDLQLMLPNQCQLLNLRIPRFMKKWINIKKTFVTHFRQWPKSLSFMLSELNIQPKGRLHSGIDDCHNIVLIMREMANKGVLFKNTSSEW